MRRMIIVIAALLLMITFLSNQALAGMGFYVKIQNHTSDNVTLKHMDSNCWYLTDFERDNIVPKWTEKKFYSEAKDLGICLFQSNYIVLEIGVPALKMGARFTIKHEGKTAVHSEASLNSRKILAVERCGAYGRSRCINITIDKNFLDD